MNTLRYLRLWALLAGKYVQVRLQYRADFAISSVGMLAGQAAALGALVMVLSSVPSLGGFSVPQIVFLYAFAVLAQAPTQILLDNLWSLRMHTNHGTFLRYYFKPLPTLVYYLADMVDLKGLALLASGLAALVWSCFALNLEWTTLRIALFPVLLVGSSLVFASLMIIAAAAAFWVKDSYSILSFVSGFRDHARYPLSIFNSAFQFLFTWIIPLGFVSWFPAQLYLSEGDPGPSLWLTPVVGLALLAVAVKVWNVGTRRWAGTGS